MPKLIKYLINHWSASSKKVTVSDLRHIHLSKGWRDIGYHRIILHPESRDFAKFEPTKWFHLVKMGRELDNDPFIEQNEVGAHTLYHNSDSVGICTVGHPDYGLHPLQEQAIIMTNMALAARFNLLSRLDDAIKGHRDFNPTQCPGDEIYELLQHIREDN